MEASDRPGTPDSPPESPAPRPKAGKGNRSHHRLVWALVVLASIVLLVSMLANWVQTQLLHSGQLSNQTEKILQNKDVQEQLSIFAVDQLYADIDVQAQIQQKLPSQLQPLAVPITTATRQLATNVAQRALASPQVQSLVSNAVDRAQQQFIDLARNKDQFVSTQGGVVTFEYGSVVADLASRIGVNPATIANIQSLIQQYSTELKQRLTTAQSHLKSTQTALAQAQAGTLSTQTRQNLQTILTDAMALRTTVAGLQAKIKSVESQVPAQLQGKLTDLQARLAQFDTRLTGLQKQTALVLADPSQANILKLQPQLTQLQTRITTLLNRQAVQHPGELVLMNSDQLSGLQSIVSLLRSLGFVLPLLALLLYLGAIYLARGWRRETLIAAGGGILGAALIVLFTRHVIGGGVVNSVAKSDTVKPAITATWNIVSEGLQQRAIFVLVIGVAFIVAGMVAGPGRYEVAVRRFLAPHLRERPAVVYGVLAVLLLLWLALLPTINNFGQVLVVLVLAALAVVGVEILRRQTAREFPPGPAPSNSAR